MDDGRARVARSVNAEMVRAYWMIGEAIVQHEQQGQERADYGARLIESLAARLKADKLKGFHACNLWWMRDFYLKYPILNAVRSELSWTHYRLLLRVEKAAAREFYEAEAAAQSWSTRELERQTSSLFYERALMARDKSAALETGRRDAEKYAPADFVKDPFVLEFLGLQDAPQLSESELKSALIAHLQEFLLELGTSFSFVARPQRITLNGDHFYLGLVFSIAALFRANRPQLDINYYTRELREEWENPPLGILLCADENEAVVRYTLPAGQEQIFASRYALQLPSEAELAAELNQELQRERALRHAS